MSFHQSPTPPQCRSRTTGGRGGGAIISLFNSGRMKGEQKRQVVLSPRYCDNRPAHERSRIPKEATNCSGGRGGELLSPHRSVVFNPQTSTRPRICSAIGKDPLLSPRFLLLGPFLFPIHYTRLPWISPSLSYLAQQ